MFKRRFSILRLIGLVVIVLILLFFVFKASISASIV